MLKGARNAFLRSNFWRLAHTSLFARKSRETKEATIYKRVKKTQDFKVKSNRT